MVNFSRGQGEQGWGVFVGNGVIFIEVEGVIFRGIDISSFPYLTGYQK
jgi:hypothetical protein